MLTVPLVDCAKQVRAGTNSNTVSNRDLIIDWGIGVSLEEETVNMVIRPSGEADGRRHRVRGKNEA
jgi:hypothetical protein